MRAVASVNVDTTMPTAPRPIRVTLPMALVNGSGRPPLATGWACAGLLGTSRTRGIGGAGPSDTTPWWTPDASGESPAGGDGEPVPHADRPVHPCRVMRVVHAPSSLGERIWRRTGDRCTTGWE